jgi:hypothetical protein
MNSVRQVIKFNPRIARLANDPFSLSAFTGKYSYTENGFIKELSREQAGDKAIELRGKGYDCKVVPFQYHFRVVLNIQ